MEVNNKTIGIVITTYNRPDLLKETFNSLNTTIIPNGYGMKIVIIDDFSQESETLRLISEYVPFDNNIEVMKIMNRVNCQMYGNLRTAFDLLVNDSNCEILCNLDSDVLLKPFWLLKLMKLHEKFPERMVSGFNASVHLNDKTSNIVDGYVFKMAAGGINLLFSKTSYYKYVRPSFDSKLQWDWKCCDIHYKENKLLIPVAYPSVVQHTGLVSTLGKPAKEAAFAHDFDLPDPEFSNDAIQELHKKADKLNVKHYNMDVIILSWAKNKMFRGITQKAIDTLISSEPNLSFNIIVVESNKNEPEYQLKSNNDINQTAVKTIYYNHEKFIYNKACNMALDMCFSDYVAVCNNDLSFTENWATEIIRQMQIGGYGSACPIAPQFRRQLEFENATKPIEGYRITKEFGGWCFVLSKNSLLKIGGKFCEDVDFWYSDNVVVDQLINVKIRHALIPTSKVYHVESKTLYSLKPLEIAMLTTDQTIRYDTVKQKIYSGKTINGGQNVLKSNNNVNTEIYSNEYFTQKHKCDKSTGKKYFKHSGNIGDVIYSLPTVKMLSNEAVICLNIDKESQSKIGSSMPIEYVEALKPLLLAQPYISEVCIYQEEIHKIDYDLDLFREGFYELEDKNIAKAHLRAFNLPLEAINERWLFVDSAPIPDINIIALTNRTPRYHSPSGLGWMNFFQRYQVKQVGFIGLVSEYQVFKKNFGRDILFVPTGDFLQVASYIAKCECYIGNASVCYAIAEGLKHKNIILEVDPNANTVWFDRMGVTHF